jgi:DNA-binding PucR family transcriptional regulator
VVDMSERLDQSATAVTDAIHRGCPELSGDMYLTTRQSTRANLGLVATMIAAGAEPTIFTAPEEALAYARTYVREGLSFELLTRVYRIGEHAYTRLWRDQLQERATGTVELAEALGYIHDWVFSYIGAINIPLGIAYSGEYDQWIRGSIAVRTEEVRAILSGARVDIVEASSRLRYRLERRHLAYVVSSADAADNGRVGRGAPTNGDMDQLAEAIAERLGASSYVALPIAGHYAGWVALSGDADADPEALASLLPPGLRIALGRPAAGIDGFRRSHHEALMARRIAELSDRAPTTIGFGSVSLDALLTHDIDEARRFVADELGPLLDESEASNRLLITLEVYLEEESSFVRTGRRLGIHENTAAYRVHRAERALQRRVSERQLELRTALRLAHLLGGAE